MFDGSFFIQIQINEFKNQTVCNDKTENVQNLIFFILYCKFKDMLIYDINYLKKKAHTKLSVSGFLPIKLIKIGPNFCLR